MSKPPFGSVTPSYAEIGRLHDKIEVLECREVQYQRFIKAGLQVQDNDKFMIDIAYPDWRKG